MKVKSIRTYPLKHIDYGKNIDVEESLTRAVKTGKMSLGALGLFMTLKGANDQIFDLYKSHANTEEETDECINELEKIGLIKVSPAVITGDGENKVIYLYNPDEIL